MNWNLSKGLVSFKEASTKPSNFTNQLLISGKKCINEFKELNQEEVKRKINNYPL